MIEIVVLLIILYYVINLSYAYTYEESFDVEVERCNSKITIDVSNFINGRITIDGLKSLLDNEITKLYNSFKLKYVIDEESVNYLMNINKYLMNNLQNVINASSATSITSELLEKIIEIQLAILLLDYIVPIQIIINEIDGKKEYLTNATTIDGGLKNIIAAIVAKLKTYIDNPTYKNTLKEDNNQYITLRISKDSKYIDSTYNATVASDNYGLDHADVPSQKLKYDPVSKKLFGPDASGKVKCFSIVDKSGYPAFKDCNPVIGEKTQYIVFNKGDGGTDVAINQTINTFITDDSITRYVKNLAGNKMQFNIEYLP